MAQRNRAANPICDSPADACGRLILDPAGALAVGTIILPAGPKDGQLVAIATTQAIATLSLVANTGQSIRGALTSISANGFASYLFRAANATWYRAG